MGVQNSGQLWVRSRWICTSSDLQPNLWLPHEESEAPQLHVFGEEGACEREKRGTFSRL